MAMLFESAQSRGDNMDMLFLSHNLHLLKIGQSLNPNFASKFSKEDAKTCISSQVPSYLLGMVLDELFESADVECTYGGEPEVFTCIDSLFELISSDDYMKTSLSENIDIALNTFGEFISYDLSINVQEMLLDDDLLNEFEDIEYDSDEIVKLIKHMINDDCLEFRIYNTEDLTLVLETLMVLKNVMIQVKEELNAKNHTNAA